MAMMPSGTSGNPYGHRSDIPIEDDLLGSDDEGIMRSQSPYISLLISRVPDQDIEADDPLHNTSDRAPLTGNIQSSERSRINPSYLTSSIPGEDRRAPHDTIDESVWDTVSRDLLAIWEKMRQVLWPKYLLGGMLQRGGGIGAAERGEGDGIGGGVRGIMGRWPDADVVLQGGMSEGLRDWDLWYVFAYSASTVRG